MGIYGQDWASYQSDSPDTTGLSFVFIKVTEGLSYVNPNWEAQRAHAHANGLVVGLYHYPHMGNPVQAELDRFLTVAQPAAGEVLCLDWEGYDPANQGVPHSAQAAYKDTFLHGLAASAPGHRSGTYCNTDYLNNVDATGHFGDFLWIATAGQPAGSPGIHTPWLFHQYSDAGVDRDYCPLASTAALAQWANTTTEDIVTPQDIAAVAAAVWNHTELNAENNTQVRMGAVLRYSDFVQAAQTRQLTAQIGALTAVVTALTDAVHTAGGLTPAQAQSAAQAGAAAALAGLGHDLVDQAPAGGAAPGAAVGG